MNIIIFNLLDKEYGVDIRQVRRVIRMRQIVPVPSAAEFVEGIINLHGNVVPVVSLCRKLCLNKDKNNAASRIIVAQINNCLIGMLVDNVADVLKVEEGNISSPGEILKDAQYLAGVAKIGQRLILIVDIEKLLTSEEKIDIATLHETIELKKKNV